MSKETPESLKDAELDRLNAKASQLADQVIKLCGALMVYDVTLKMVLSLSTVPDFDFLKVQINAARDAYLLSADEESMVPLQFVAGGKPNDD